jgi:hypothetical protein
VPWTSATEWITDNWHIEDNLTLLLEMGVAKVGS